VDRLLTGRRIINSENHLRELWPFLTKKLAKRCYFDCFCIPLTNHHETWNLQAPFLPGGVRKGRLGASSLSERLAPSPDYAKVLERRHHVHTCMRGRALDCSHRAWRAHGARRQRWRATWDWHMELGVVSDGPRRDRVHRWRPGGGTRRRRACPGVTRRDARSFCRLARRHAGPSIRWQSRDGIRRGGALQCMLQCVKTKHNITKLFVFKSSMVCNMVKYVLEIIVVWFQLFIWRLLVYQMRPVVNLFFFVSCDVIWYKIKLSRFTMARNVEKSWTSLQIWCYAWCRVIK